MVLVILCNQKPLKSQVYLKLDCITLRTFALTAFAHPYCARNSCGNVMPRHVSSARAEKTFQTNIGLVAVLLTSRVVSSLIWSVTPSFFDTQLCFCDSPQIVNK